MGCVYFTRHGQTIWNVENKICGATDIALTQLGHEQAVALGQRIKKEELKIDEILYSPLMRAADTAKHISEETGIPCREEPRLTEQNFGKYESTPRDGVVFQEAKKLKEESDSKTYLLVAHNGIARVVNSYFYDMDNEEYAAFGIRNCEIRKYEFTDASNRTN